MEHTPEPWKQDERYIVGDIPHGRPGGEVIACCQPTIMDPGCKKYPVEIRVANSARIVACVNACAGITDPESMKDVMDWSDKLDANMREPITPENQAGVMAMRGICLRELHHALRRAKRER